MKRNDLKTVLIVILALALLLSVSACGNNSIPTPSVSPEASTSEASPQSAAPEPAEQTPAAETPSGGAAAETPDVFIIGGADIYEQTLPRVEVLHLTVIHARWASADAFFPALDMSQWQEVEREHHTSDARNAYEFDFVTLKRREP